MIIEEDGITFQGLRIFKYTRFPMYLSFDEIRIKPVWGGRILVFASGEEMKRIRRILLFGGIWVMPFKWKESIEVIKNFQSPSVTRASCMQNINYTFVSEWLKKVRRLLKLQETKQKA